MAGTLLLRAPVGALPLWAYTYYTLPGESQDIFALGSGVALAAWSTSHQVVRDCVERAPWVLRHPSALRPRVAMSGLRRYAGGFIAMGALLGAAGPVARQIQSVSVSVGSVNYSPSWSEQDQAYLLDDLDGSFATSSVAHVAFSQPAANAGTVAKAAVASQASGTTEDAEDSDRYLSDPYN